MKRESHGEEPPWAEKKKVKKLPKAPAKAPSTVTDSWSIKIPFVFAWVC